MEKKGYVQKAQRNFEKADKLAKVERQMFDKLDEIEGKSSKVEAENKSAPPEGQQIQPQKLQPDKKQTRQEVVRDVLTKKTVFAEFISFVGNGFKIKKDDKKGES
jgi:hypothetical protein